METFAQQYMHSHRHQCFDIPVLAFYCVGFRREVWQAVGPLDEQFEIGMFEDDDYAQRVKQHGLRIVCAEDVFVHHYGEATFNELKRDTTYEHIFATNRQRFETKWGIKWQAHQVRSNTLQ